MRLRTVIVVCFVLAGCGKGGSSAPTQPSSSASPSPPPPTAASPLPLGVASAVDAGCPAGSPAGSQCKQITVACTGISIASATLRTTPPAAGAPGRGTIVLTTGGDGTALERSTSPLAAAMISTFNGDGLVAVEIGWNAPGIWGGPQPRTLACRYATAARWVYDNIHSGGRSLLFAAQGTSGGASQIAFALAHYGGSDFIALANLGGGPPGCPLCSPDGVHPPEPLLPGAPPSVNRDPQLSYPTTVVRFFLGDGEPTPDIIADANAYFAAITSTKSMTIVPGTPHNIGSTQAGVDAYVQSVRDALGSR